MELHGINAVWSHHHIDHKGQPTAPATFSTLISSNTSNYLKVADISKFQQLKLYFNPINRKQPEYFNSFDFTQNH